MQFKRRLPLILLLMAVLTLIITSVSASSVISVIDKTDKSVTVKDILDREVKIKSPVEKIVVLDAHQQVTTALEAMGAYDKIVGVDLDTSKEKLLFPNIGQKDFVGTKKELDLEEILKLDPDVVFDVGTSIGDEVKQMQDVGLPVVTVSLYPNPVDHFDPTIENTRVIGTIVGAENTANEFADWKEKYLNIIKERVANIPEDKKVTSLYTYRWTNSTLSSSGIKNRFHSALDFIGTKDVNNDLDVDWAVIDLEDILKKNPQFIVFEEMNHMSGYDVNDTSAMEKDHSAVRSLPGLNTVDAVKNNKIYGLPSVLISGDTWLAAIYLAPVIYPELFKDFDPVKIHQEYVDKYLKLDMDISDDTFIYPKP